jgi:hypothetical protein
LVPKLIQLFPLIDINTLLDTSYFLMSCFFKKSKSDSTTQTHPSEVDEIKEIKERKEHEQKEKELKERVEEKLKSIIDEMTLRVYFLQENN